MKNKFSWIKNYILRRKNRFKQRIIFNVYKRQTKLLNKPLYINNIPTKTKICWLKNDNEINNFLRATKELDYYLAYFVNLKTSFNTINFQMQFDFVVVDLSYKVIYLEEKISINQKFEFKNVVHLFLFTPGSIQNLNIKLNDKVCPLTK